MALISYQVVYKPLAQIEIEEAYDWYEQPNIQMGEAFLVELERTSGFLASSPYLYAKVDGDARCAHLSRFPYTHFYVVDGKTVNVLSCFHQHRNPKSRSTLIR